MRTDPENTGHRPSLKRRPTYVLALLACLALAAIGCGKGTGGDSVGTAPAPPQRVFLIVVDTLRADHLGAYGYPRATSPSLDEMATEAVVFEHAIAQWPFTGPSMAAMFTGRYPHTTGLTHKPDIRLPEPYLTLPELFQGDDYTTMAVIGNAVLSSKLGWNQGFDEFVEPWELAPVKPKTPLEWRAVLTAEKITDEGIRLLEAHAADPKLFVWLHYGDPHTPYVLPDGVENPFLEDEYYSGERKVGSWFRKQDFIDNRQELDFYIAQYDANVLVVDRAIRRFLDRARELGLLENTLVVFTSDHGEGLGEHDELTHGKLPYNSSAQVPLFFWQPSVIDGNRRIERPVELLDLYPTFRDLLFPEREIDGLEGSSLVDFLRPPPDGSSPTVERDDFRYAFSAAGGKSRMHYRSIQSREWKLIALPERRNRGRTKRYELFDLASDPGETNNLIESRLDEARALQTDLVAWIRQPRIPVETADEEPPSEETIDALKALGYLN